MSSAPDEAFEVLGGILAKVKDVIGDGASQAMLHYAAVSEGKRLAERYDGDLPDVLVRLRSIVGPGADVIESKTEVVRVVVPDSPLLRAGDPTLDGVLVGLLEGVLSAHRRLKYTGEVARHNNGVKQPVVELRPARHVKGGPN